MTATVNTTFQSLRMTLAAAFMVVGVMAAAPAGAQTMSEPEPSMDNPRQIVMSMNFKDEARVNSMLYNVINIQKAYGQDNVEIVVVGWGPGVRMLLQDSPVRARIESLMQYEIGFIACGNTLQAIGIDPENLIDKVDMVKAGLPEIVERERSGWSVIWP